MEKQRELKAIAKAILILTKEVVENPTISIRDAYRYVLREITTPTLASEAAYNDFYLKTGKDIREFDWRSSRQIISKSGEKFSIHKVYTGDHIQTCRDFEIMLKKAYEKGLLTEDFIVEQLNNRYVCWITKAEDRRLNELGYKSNRPNPEEAYREAGIVIYHPLVDEDFKKLQNAVRIQAKKTQPQFNKAITYCSKNTFVFKNEMRFNKERRRRGFITLDNEGRLVAVVAMHEDKRGAAYGQAELCFYDEYKSEFGEWRLVAVNKERLSFSKLAEILKTNNSYKVTIDPRKGS